MVTPCKEKLKKMIKNSLIIRFPTWIGRKVFRPSFYPIGWFLQRLSQFYLSIVAFLFFEVINNEGEEKTSFKLKNGKRNSLIGFVTQRLSITTE
jgi:hypothetical protein